MKNLFSIATETAKWCQSNSLVFESHASVTSTNDLAKKEAMHLNVPLKIYIADQQSAGRGRNTNTWSNPDPGSALMCTWSYLCLQQPQAITAPLLGLAIYKALKNVFENAELSIKPPNDIYLKDKKILGLLVETIQTGSHIRMIIGFGLNVFSHPQNIELAGHLSEHLTITTEIWAKLLQQIHGELTDGVRSSYATHLTMSQREELLHAVNLNPFTSEKFVSISPFGDLAYKDETISWRDL